MDKLSLDVIGPHLDVYNAKASAGNKRYQNGGAVTALLKAALDEGLADRVIAMGADRWAQKAYASVVSDSSGLDKAAGSIYTNTMPLRP